MKTRMNSPPIHYMNTLLILFANIKNDKMKKLILIITILFTNINVNSQITKGYWMYGGSGSYTHKLTKINDNIDTDSFITIEPNAGYFVNDNWAVGGIVRYINYMGDIHFNNQYGLGIFTRYYFLKPDRITNIFAQANYTYVLNHYQFKDFIDNAAFHLYGVKIGYVVFFTDNVGFETFLDYEKENYRSITALSSNSTIIKIGMGFHIHLH